MYLKHWFLRDSHERGNSSRKIFETYSRLNLQDAMNMVNKQNISCMNGYSNNNGNNNNPPEKSLTSLFRTYTESNFSGSNHGVSPVAGEAGSDVGNNAGSLPPSFTSICIDNNASPSHGFNFDLANLDYSPSHRDLAAAEIHHILSDNLFKPVRRVSLKL